MKHALRRVVLSLSSLGASACAPAVAFACPSCPTAEVVRASLLDDRFWNHLSLICLPLVVLALISAVLYRIGVREETLAEPGARPERTSR